MSFSFRLTIGIFLAGCLFCFALPISRDGRALAAIVTPSSPHPAEDFAALELQHWLGEITGAKLPILPAAEAAAFDTLLVLGASAATTFQADLDYLAGTDGCAIRRQGNAIHLFGALPKGTLNAVYTFLEHNTDIIWPRARYVVFSVQPTLDAKQLDLLDRPLSTCRGWGFTIAGTKEPDFLWQVRNRNNFGGQNHGPNHEKFGLFQEVGGHNFSSMVPAAKYWETHPEFFPVINGLRAPKAGCLCLTAPGLQEVFIANVLERVSQYPQLTRFVLGIDDTWQTCECAACNAPITLPDGTTIAVDDPAYLSTRWYQFIAPAVTAVQERFGIQVKVYAYFYAALPPRLQLPENLCALICPVPKNEKKSFFDQSGQGVFGKDWSALILDFQKVARHIMIREYYGCTGTAPRAQEYVAAEDLRFCLKNGITEFTSEVPVDRIDQRFDPMPSVYWDASAITFWTINRLWWNPSQDVDTLRQHFFTRTYRGAAPAMESFHNLLRDQWLQNTTVSSYMDNNLKFSQTHILEAGLEERCRELLVAAEAQADHPVSLELVKAARANFGRGLNLDSRMQSRFAAEADDFSHPAWNDCRSHDDFQRLGHPSESYPELLSVKSLNDQNNLYLRFTATRQPDQDRPALQETQDQWPQDAFISVHLTSEDKKIYRTFAFDEAGNTVDAERLNRSWNSNFTVKTQSTDASWEVIVTIPLETIDFTFGKDVLNRIYGNFHYRSRHPKRPMLSDFSWQGRRVGVTRFFGEISLAEKR